MHALPITTPSMVRMARTLLARKASTASPKVSLQIMADRLPPPYHKPAPVRGKALAKRRIVKAGAGCLDSPTRPQPEQIDKKLHLIPQRQFRFPRAALRKNKGDLQDTRAVAEQLA